MVPIGLETIVKPIKKFKAPLICFYLRAYQEYPLVDQMYLVSLGFMRHTRLSMRTSLVYLCLFSVLTLILIINSESPGLTLRGNKMRFTLCLIFGIVCFLTCTLLSTQVHKQVYLSGDLCIMRILRKKHFGMLKSSLCLAGIFL